MTYQTLTQAEALEILAAAETVLVEHFAPTWSETIGYAREALTMGGQAQLGRVCEVQSWANDTQRPDRYRAVLGLCADVLWAFMLGEALEAAGKRQSPT